MIRDRFLETVLIKAGIPQDDKFGYFMEQAEPVLTDRVLTNVMGMLNEEQIDTFSKLVENEASEDDVYTYLCSVIPDYENFIWGVYKEFEEMYIENYHYFSGESSGESS